MDSFRQLYRDPQIQRSLDLVFSIVGIYTCYLYYGILQNTLYVEQKDGTKFGSTSFVLLVQCAINAAVAFVYDIIFSALPKAKDDHLHDDKDIIKSSSSSGSSSSGSSSSGTVSGNKSVTVSSSSSTIVKSTSFFKRLLAMNVALTGFVYIGAMYSSNESLKYVSYAYQALAKSCKPIPVLLSSVLISGKRYPMVKYICVSAMVLGVTLFQFLDDGKGSKSGPHGSSKGNGGGSSGNENSFWGVLFLIISLIFDGINGPLQENVKKFLSETDQVIANNLWAMFVMFFAALFMDQILPSVSRQRRRLEMEK